MVEKIYNQKPMEYLCLRCNDKFFSYDHLPKGHEYCLDCLFNYEDEFTAETNPNEYRIFTLKKTVKQKNEIIKKVNNLFKDLEKVLYEEDRERGVQILNEINSLFAKLEVN